MKKLIKVGLLFIGIFLPILVMLGYTVGIGNTSIKDSEKYTYIKVAKEKIRLIQKGTGKDILLVHGSPGSIEDWKEILDVLSKDYRVTAFDRPGHGYSSSKAYTYHIADNATFIDTLINTLGLQSPLIVGHSYGGSTVAHMALHSKHKDLKYIIIDSPLYSFQPDTAYRLVSIPLLGKGIALLSSFTLANSMIKKGIKPMLKYMDKEKADGLIKERQNIWSQTKVIYSKSKEAVNYQKDLNEISSNYKNIKSKITLITGKDTEITFNADCKRFHNEVSASELIELEEVGHYIQFDKPQTVIKAIKEEIN
ncbi:MAG: alpha/beta fold hydrolase [Tenacibaculum sp.]